MIKRLLLIVALGAALTACSPSGSSPAVDASDAAPSMDTVSPSP